MEAIKKLLLPTFILWSVLIGLDSLSFLPFKVGLLLHNVFVNGSGVFLVSTVVAILQGCLIRFEKWYSFIILPIVFILIQTVDILIISYSTDSFIPEMCSELIVIRGFLLCPYVELVHPLAGSFQWEGPLTFNQIVWCFQYSVFIGLYYFIVFCFVKQLIRRRFRTTQYSKYDK